MANTRDGRRKRERPVWEGGLSPWGCTSPSLRSLPISLFSTHTNPKVLRICVLLKPGLLCYFKQEMEAGNSQNFWLPCFAHWCLEAFCCHWCDIPIILHWILMFIYFSIFYYGGLIREWIQWLNWQVSTLFFLFSFFGSGYKTIWRQTWFLCVYLVPCQKLPEYIWGKVIMKQWKKMVENLRSRGICC